MSILPHSTLPFVYQPLDVNKNEIRLLRIAPSVDATSVISGTLDHVSLRYHPPYEALSYTWADDVDNDTQDFVILLNGHCFEIAQNLGAALRQLRLNTCPRVFWIDAICINQNNNVERSEQVSKMKAIYIRATRVVSWIGKEYARSGAAFEFFHALLQYDSLEQWYDRVDNELGAKSKAAAIITAVVVLFGRRYWTRVWILQELAFAKDVAFVCGPDTISWNALQINCTLFKKAKIFLEHTFGGTPVGHMVQNLHRDGPNTMESIGHSGNHAFANLGCLLAKHRFKFATDPKDKVYSLLGMASNVTQQNFLVDYRLNTSHIYCDTAKFLVANEQSLEFLGENKLPQSKSWLPSWVTDWTNANGSMSNPISSFRPYSASGSTRAEAIVNSSSNSISVKGICISTVKSSSVQLGGFDPSVVDFLPVFTLFHEWWKPYFSTGRTAIVGPGSFVDVVTFGQWYHRCDIKELAQESEKFIKNFSILLRKYMDALAPLDDTLQSLVDVEDVPAEGSVLRRAQSNIWYTVPKCRDRRFLVSDGNAIGIGPQCMGEGDLICVIMGCSVPIILRRVTGPEEHYVNLGDAYVNNFMGGEVLNGLQSGKYNLQVFDIR